MKLAIVTPAPKGSTKGNRITAIRWQRILETLKHSVKLLDRFSDEDCDLLIALHARKSATSVRQFRRSFPDRPVVVALTGTDLHVDLKTKRAKSTVNRTLELADKIVMLEREGKRVLAPRFQKKVHVIYQSASPLKSKTKQLQGTFEVSVIGHLRPVKNPFHAARAAQNLPSDSNIKIVQIGAALSESMERMAIQEMSRNPRYSWLGPMSHNATQRRLARSHATVISSRVEGAPSVISEAIVNRVPVIASRIAGTIGTLPKGYPGFYSCGDISGLGELLLKCERESEFRNELLSRLEEVEPRFRESNETEEWRLLLKSIMKKRS